MVHGKKVVYWVGVVILAAIWLAAAPAPALAEILLYVDGNEVYCDQPPIMQNDRVLVPIGPTVKALDLYDPNHEMYVVWHEDEQWIEIVSRNVIDLWIGSTAVKYRYRGLDVGQHAESKWEPWRWPSHIEWAHHGPVAFRQRIDGL